MANGDDVEEPVAPAGADPRRGHPHPPDEPEADLLEQELPADDDVDAPTGLDAERVEPLDDDERPAG
jgi:hypothetical protein